MPESPHSSHTKSISRPSRSRGVRISKQDEAFRRKQREAGARLGGRGEEEGGGAAAEAEGRAREVFFFLS